MASSCNHTSESLEPQDQSRRSFIKIASAGAVALACRQEVFGAKADSSLSGPPAPISNRAPLAAQPYMLLPVGSIKPRGWLRKQLSIQAAGLSGHLGEIWPDVGNDSAWLGGTGEAWERGPYYLDGLLPLAWLLDSEPLKAKAQRFVDWTLDHPSPNGMIGPASNDDWWPRMVMLKALSQYFELTGDPRVIPTMTRYFHFQLQALKTQPLAKWGRARWQDELVSVVWLYNRTGDSQLLDLARLLHEQGLDWRAEFERFPFKERVTYRDVYLEVVDPTDPPDRFLFSHGVNNAMAIKASALWSLVSGDNEDRAAVQRQLATLDQYHGLPIGIFSADEHLAGRNPSQGVELCAVVETMFSLEHALAITGDPALADRLERIAYNALPAPFTNDMWAHQYDQQTNQIDCSLGTTLGTGPWATNTGDANLFGLEPMFGCCTANFHQGWPKLTASLWMGSSDGGLAAMIYAPCELSARVQDVVVRVIEATDYPFRDQIRLEIAPERPLKFPLRLRVPARARDTKVRLNGREIQTTAKDGFMVVERTWHREDVLDIAFDFETRAVAGFNQSISVEHGALLFSLPIGERWEKLRNRGLGAADWEVYPTTAWNYGIEEGTRFERKEHPISSVPFSRQAPPVTVAVSARSVPEWTSNETYAPSPPLSPVILSGSAPEIVTLFPYGAAKLRITSFPTVKG